MKQYVRVTMCVCVCTGAGVMARSFQMRGDTTLLPYEPTSQLLSETLRSYNQVQAVRNVFILCSAPHVTNLFEQVRSYIQSFTYYVAPDTLLCHTLTY